LIFKALAGILQSYQQSYPQILWTESKDKKNQ